MVSPSLFRSLGLFSRCAFLLSFALPAVMSGLLAQSLDRIDPAIFESLEYRHIGPLGNRVSAVTGVPGDRNVYFAGAASGGVFKTEDGGAHWEPVFDAQTTQSIGALAIAPSDPNVIWAGTGEAHIRSNVSIGNGVYKSTDGGKTWQHMGLEKTGRISRIVIHPQNSEIVLAAALGHCYGPQQDRGVFRTRDGGGTWEHVLFVDENTGASDIVMDPNNPRILLAGTWQMVVWTWGRQSGGPGSGLYKSTDGGATWKQLTGKGLPDPPWGKTAVAMSADNSSRVYALIETNSNDAFAPLEEHQGVLWTSDDGGENWRLTNSDHTLAQRPLYYTRVVAAPDNHNEVYFMSTQQSISRDGGKSSERFPVAGDHHDMWIDPLIPERMIVGHDQGISISSNRGKSWFRPQLPIAQMYHIHTDNQVPYNVFGNRQDGSSMAGPSNTLTGGEIPLGAWHSVGGCESGFAIPDPVEDSVVWSGCYEGILERYDKRTGHSRNVSIWPDNAEAWAAKDLKYRFQWTFPIAISPHNPQRVYVGSQFVHVTTDGGHSWQVISPDLSTNDLSRQQRTGGLTPDDAGPTMGTTLFAIAESPLEEGVIWAGTNDGLLHITRNFGKEWINVTSLIPDLPSWGTISNIEPSRFEPGRAYIAVDFHQVNNSDPYVYRTTDYGQTWTSISPDLPRSVFSYAHCIREDPVRQGLLYLGTENAVYVSFNDGQNWQPLQTNLPHAPAHWLTVQEHFNDLVVATYGRGFWILDDITPLQQLNPDVLSSDVHLFTPRPAYRFRFRESHMSQPGDPAAGQNPPYGASIHYFLKEKPQEAVQISILDKAGNTVRVLKDSETSDNQNGGDSGRVSNKKGINRVYWDLRYERTREAQLRTKPWQHSHVPLGEKGWRRLVEGRRVGVLVPPGIYTVELKVGDKTHTRSLEVRKDPHSAGTVADIETQTEVLLELREMINTAVDLINEIEWVRKQLNDLKVMLRGRESLDDVLEEGRKLDQSLRELENHFFDLRLTNARQDTLRWGRQLYSKMTLLAASVGQSDFPPTTQQIQVFQIYKEQVSEYQQRMTLLREKEISDYNRLLRQKGVPSVMTGLE